jgi:hypothetical protein
MGNSSQAKLLRNMASAYLSLDELHKASEELTIAERLEPWCPFALFLRFKLAVLQDNEAEGMISQ